MHEEIHQRIPEKIGKGFGMPLPFHGEGE